MLLLHFSPSATRWSAVWNLLQLSKTV